VNEIFFGHADVGRDPGSIIGVISLLIWSLTIIVAFKYIVMVLRADSDGEGGVFALLSLILKNPKKKIVALVLMLLLAAGLLYGDGIITPAISVLSAVEGLGIITKSFEPFIIPITIVILTALFYIQKNGTAKIGKLFSPIIVVWFISIGLLGLLQIIGNVEILAALNPLNAIRFLFETPIQKLMLIMGSVMLVVTGGEAMYADMGHFGKQSIRVSWFVLVYPMLLLNYLGQGAFLLSGNEVQMNNIFFSMVPQVALIPMVILATCATVIASQALISGAFSLTSQAISLGYLPRLHIVHTNEGHHGQIYIPAVNTILYIGCIILILLFRSSQNIASAYGLAVSGVMLATSIAMIYVSRNLWKWSAFKSYGIFGSLIVFESFFLLSNMLKIAQGGWIPLAIALAVVLIMRIWYWGKTMIENTHKNLSTTTIKELIAHKDKAHTALAHSSVFMSNYPVLSVDDKVPPLLQVFWERYGVLPKNIIILHVETFNEPYVDEDQGQIRYKIAPLYENGPTGSMYGVVVYFGFMENPDVELILEDLARKHEIKIEEDPKKWLIHILHSRVYISKKVGQVKRFLLGIYKFLNRNSMHADGYFGLGNNIDLTIEAIPTKIT
jgi:KUP system potassium uptake protein